MKYLIYPFLLAFIIACDESSSPQSSEYTGRELVYDLYQASEYPISGTVTFAEKSDLSIEVRVHLSGMEGDAYYPVHLHEGDLSTPDAEILFLLNDVYGKTGESNTIIKELNDGSFLTYERIKDFKGSVKIHLAPAGPEADIVLAGGNIGKSVGAVSGRQDIATCQSE